MTELTTRQSVLAEASEIISKDRNTSYGTPEKNFEMIAAFWSTYLGYEVKAHDVAVMMTFVKCARIKTSPDKRDNWVDAAGYMACGYEVVCTENAAEIALAIEPKTEEDNSIKEDIKESDYTFTQWIRDNYTKAEPGMI